MPLGAPEGGRGIALPEMREGNLLAFFPAGAYGASMASDHCLRGGAMEIAVRYTCA